jgi:hypothetical protein
MLPWLTPSTTLLGDLNIADMATRGKVDIKYVGYGSVWQTGPSYLRGSRETWPVRREFLKQNSQAEPTQDPAVGRASLQLGAPAHSVCGVIPKEEMRNKYYTFVNYVSRVKGLYQDSATS